MHPPTVGSSSAVAWYGTETYVRTYDPTTFVANFGWRVVVPEPGSMLGVLVVVGLWRRRAG